MTKNKNYMGMLIKKSREENGFSLEKVSELTGISTRYLQKIENEGQIPSYKTLSKIVTSLSMDSNPLFYCELDEDDIKKKNIIMRIKDCSSLQLELITAILNVFSDDK